jgi:O-antigen/teichoic acid export membrane protein
VSRVVFPVYAQLWRTAPTAIAGVYYSLRRSVSLLYGLVCGALIGGAHLLIKILYDPRYEGAALWLSFLMISVALRLPNFATSQFLTAAGDIKSNLRMNFVRLTWLAVAIPIGFLRFGALGVVGAVGLVEIPAMLFSWSILHRAKVLKLREEFLFIAVVGLSAAASYAGSRAILSIVQL